MQRFMSHRVLGWIMADRLSWKHWVVQAVTAGRAVLIALFVAISLWASPQICAGWFVVAMGVLVVSSVTDLLDGWLARRWAVTTRLGAHADPLMDKIFYLATFPTLVWLAAALGQDVHARLLLGLTVLFLLRDQWVSFLRSLGAMHGVDAKANWSGKARTLISFPAVCVIYFYLQAPRGWAGWLAIEFVYVLEVACMVINLVSIWVYTARYRPCLMKELAGGVSANDD